ncbi:rhomboid family intramembrane serine protease [Oceanobacillus bengalensis]|uniref:Rhomboid family intramembrane serine protease n=1 Tax=Oceanobacillus bengalensis TaxID=1435466 RepID=A0A494Z5K8_9BACI|nr:rhomboid family intramembrane serine protease [Oceanobacillus bengalensis]RKQ17818.1 rhomboid family intramembrane serine protease [Oceanobacillus bengalensis]
MHLNEQYMLYKIAYQLVESEKYEILHIDTNINEIWLELYQNKKSKVIRLIHKGFDWQNHLRKDIAIVFQKAKNMKKLLRGKEIEIYNIYVSSYPPVDDWEALKRPMQLKEKNPVKMNVYYLDEENYKSELTRLIDTLDVNKITQDDSYFSDEELEVERKRYKEKLVLTVEEKRKEIHNVFSFGKPFFTFAIIILNIIMFILLEINGGSMVIDTLIDYGAKYNPAIIENNEWWRIISSMFLHIGFLHLLMNMLAVYYLGTAVEKIYGKWRFIFIYSLAGIGGGLASFAFSANVSAGASGAIFGLFGALLFFGIIHKRIFFQTMGLNILVVLGINIAFGFTLEQIDMAAHIGGLVAGFIASAIIHLPNKKKIVMQFVAMLVYVVMVAGLIYFGTYNNLNNQTYYLMEIESLIEEEQFETVVEVATEALETGGDREGLLLFQRSYAYIELDMIERAIDDLENSITYEAIPESYHNLSLLYFNQGNIEAARENIRKAYRMDSTNESFKELYEEIIGEPGP